MYCSVGSHYDECCHAECRWPQQNDTQHNVIQQNDTQDNVIQHDDTQHNDIQQNDTKHKDIIYDTQHNKILTLYCIVTLNFFDILNAIMLGVIMLSVLWFFLGSTTSILMTIEMRQIRTLSLALHKVSLS